MIEPKPIKLSPGVTLRRWYAGQQPSAAHLNEGVDVLRRMVTGAPPPRSVVQVRAVGGTAGFDWAVLRTVDVANKIIEVQRIRYTDQPPDSEEASDYNSGCYRKIETYGDVVTAYPPPCSPYSFFNDPANIRPVDEIPAGGEDLGWTICPVKLYGDGTIEWADKCDASPEAVDPNDDTVSE